MKLILADNEKLIKEWEYGHIEQKKADPITKTVILTDKRVIAETSTPYKVDRVEITNADIDGVSSAFGEKRIVALLVIAVIGLLAAIVGMIIPETAVIIVGLVVAALFGALWWFIKRCGFAVVITKRKTEETAFSIGVFENTEQKKLRFGTRKHKEPKIRLQVNNEIAREISDTISNYLFN